MKAIARDGRIRVGIPSESDIGENASTDPEGEQEKEKLNPKGNAAMRGKRADIIETWYFHSEDGGELRVAPGKR